MEVCVHVYEDLRDDFINRTGKSKAQQHLRHCNPQSLCSIVILIFPSVTQEAPVSLHTTGSCKINTHNINYGWACCMIRSLQLMPTGWLSASAHVHSRSQWSSETDAYRCLFWYFLGGGRAGDDEREGWSRGKWSAAFRHKGRLCPCMPRAPQLELCIRDGHCWGAPSSISPEPHLSLGSSPRLRSWFNFFFLCFFFLINQTNGR